MMAATGYNLASVSGLFGGTIFYKDEDAQEPFAGTDEVTASTVIYSVVPLETLLTYL